MIELLLLVCLRAEPEACAERRLTFAEPGLTPAACAMFAQPVIAGYMARHPNSRVRRWTCGAPGRTAFAGETPGEAI
jgi:hypothetical protein